MAINVHMSHYRWGNDDGTTEANYSFAAAQDTNLSAVAEGATLLLRVGMQETGNTAASNHDFRLRRSINGGAFADVTTTSTHVKAVAAASFADAANTTQRLTSMTGTFEASSQGCSEDGLAGGAQCDIVALGNAECVFAVQFVTADLNPADVVTFDITSPDSTITNDVVPTATVANPIALTPSTKAVTVTTFAPTVTASANQTLTPITKAVTVTTYAPTVSIGTTLTPATKAVTVTTYAPTVSVSSGTVLTPGTKAVAVTTYAPTVAVSDNKFLTPSTLAVIVSTFAPSVSVGTVLTPGAKSVSVTTYPPTVTVSGGGSSVPCQHPKDRGGLRFRHSGGAQYSRR